MYRDRTKILEGASFAVQNIYGSTKTSRFLKDLADGTNSIDFVIVGDSNTGSAAAGMWGYHNGLSQTLHDKGYTCYATPVYPSMTDQTANATAGGWRSGCDLYVATATLKSGNVSGQSTPYAIWSPVGFMTNPGNYPNVYVRYGANTTNSYGPWTDSWAYLEAGSSTYFNSFGVGITPDHPLAQAGITLYYRIRYGKFSNASATNGGFCPMALKGSGSAASAGTELTARRFVSTQTQGGETEGSYFVDEATTWTTATHTSYRGTWSFTSPSGGTKGPVAIHTHSIYAKRKGWSVTSLCYMGGFSSGGIADIMDGVKTTSLRYHLRELRERQIAAGGSGRVVIMAQSGVNQYADTSGETPTKWVDGHKKIWNAFKEAWTYWGYSLDDLAIVSWCSHPINSADTSSSGTTGNMIAVRAAANEMAKANPDMTVVDVKQLMNYNQLLTGLVNGQSLFQYWNGIPVSGQPDFPAHLAGGTVTTGSSVTATNATFDSTSFTLTGAYATEGTTTNYFTNRVLEVVEVGYVSAGTLANVSASTGGNFTCTAFTSIAVNRPIVVSGTLTGTATITGYSNPTTYYIIGSPTSTAFQLSSTYGGSAITTTAGTTTGLTFTVGVQNRQPQLAFITEYNGSTKVAKVRAWPGGTPSNSGGGITPLDVGAAGNKNVTYKLITLHPADGYTVVSTMILNSLLAVTP